MLQTVSRHAASGSDPRLTVGGACSSNDRYPSIAFVSGFLPQTTKAKSVLARRLTGPGYGRPLLFKKQLRPALVRWRHRGVTERDIFLSSYPRSGSTWLRFLLFDLLTGEEALFGVVNQSIPYVGQQSQAPSLLPGGGRLIKTHEPYIRGFKRAVYIVRDARSVVLSEYRFMRMRFGYRRDFDHFLDEFLRGEVNPFGRWDAHVRFWLDSSIAEKGNLLVIRFEDMRQNTLETLKTVTAFLGAEPNEQALVDAIANNDVGHMRAKEQRALQRTTEKLDRRFPFVGEGSATGWSSGFSEEQLLRLEQAMASSLKRLGYRSEV
jgi:hypothetical protein